MQQRRRPCDEACCKEWMIRPNNVVMVVVMVVRKVCCLKDDYTRIHQQHDSENKNTLLSNLERKMEWMMDGAKDLEFSRRHRRSRVFLTRCAESSSVAVISLSCIGCRGDSINVSSALTVQSTLSRKVFHADKSFAPPRLVRRVCHFVATDFLEYR